MVDNRNSYTHTSRVEELKKLEKESEAYSKTEKKDSRVTFVILFLLLATSIAGNIYLFQELAIRTSNFKEQMEFQRQEMASFKLKTRNSFLETGREMQLILDKKQSECDSLANELIKANHRKVKRREKIPTQ